MEIDTIKIKNDYWFSGEKIFDLSRKYNIKRGKLSEIAGEIELKCLECGSIHIFKKKTHLNEYNSINRISVNKDFFLCQKCSHVIMKSILNGVDEEIFGIPDNYHVNNMIENEIMSYFNNV